MTTFSDLNLNVTNLPERAIDQLVEQAIKLGYDNLGLAVEFEFPSVVNNKLGDGKKKEPKAQINIPMAKVYKLPGHLQARLEAVSRRIKIYSRITIRIKPSDIKNYLHHLVIASQ